MSIISKLLESVHLNGDDEEDDYYLDDDYEDEDDRPARKGLFAKKDDDDYYDDEEEYDQKPRFLSSSPKVAPMNQRTMMEVSMVKPTSIEDAREI